MTGVRPKSEFMQPPLLTEIAVEFVRQVFIQNVLRYPPLMPADIGIEVMRKQAGNRHAAGAAASSTD